MRAKATWWDWAWWGAWIARHHRKILIGIALGTMFCIVGLLRVHISSDSDDFRMPESKAINETLRNSFEQGSSEEIYFLSRSGKSVLHPDMLQQQLRTLKALHKRFHISTYSLAEALDEALKRTTGKSLLETDEYQPIGDALLSLTGPATARDLEKVSRSLVSDPHVLDVYQARRVLIPLIHMSAGRRLPEIAHEIPAVEAVRAYMVFDADYTSEQMQEIVPIIREITEAHETGDLRVQNWGTEQLKYDIDLHSTRNAFWMGLILVLIDIVCLWIFFRSGREVVLTLLILVTAAIWSFGLAGWLGIRFSFLQLIVLPILLGTGIDDCVVFGRRMSAEQAHHQRWVDALSATYQATGKGIFLTTVTTLIAFLTSAIFSSAVATRSFCLTVSLSMFIVFVLTILMEGALRTTTVAGNGPLTVNKPQKARTSRWTTITTLGLKYPRTTVLICLLALIASIVPITYLKSESSPRIFLRKGMHTYTSFEDGERLFQSNIIGYILFEGNVEDTRLIGKLQELETRLKTVPHIDQIMHRPNIDSIMTLLAKRRIVVTPETALRQVFDQLSTSNDIADHVRNVTYADAAKQLLHKSGDRYDKLLVRLLINSVEFEEIGETYRALVVLAEDLQFQDIPGLRYRIGGRGLSNYIESTYLIKGMLQSFVLSLIGTLIALMVIWRRGWNSILAIAPLLVGISLTAVVMILCDIKLNILNLTIGAIAIGLGIDYPIHLIERYEEERQRTDTRNEAMRRALTAMAPALLAASLTTIIGFSAACILTLPIASSFGLLIALSTALIYIATILFLPSIVVVSHKRPPSGQGRCEP